MKKINALVCAIVIALTTQLGTVEAATYTELFPSSGTLSQDDELRAQGWCGGNPGDPFCNNPKGSAGNSGGEGAISAGIGNDGTQGFAFWSKTNQASGSFLYTEEFGFNSADLLSISWYQRDSAADPTHLAFRIGADWYISTQTFNHIGANGSDWAYMNPTVSTLTFFQLSGSGNTSFLPSGTAATTGSALPLGDVNALGFWWDERKTGTSRIDSVTLSTVAAVPLPAALPLLLLAIGGLLGVSRAGRRVT